MRMGMDEEKIVKDDTTNARCAAHAYKLLKKYLLIGARMCVANEIVWWVLSAHAVYSSASYL